MQTPYIKLSQDKISPSALQDMLYIFWDDISDEQKKEVQNILDEYDIEND